MSRHDDPTLVPSTKRLRAHAAALADPALAGGMVTYHHPPDRTEVVDGVERRVFTFGWYRYTDQAKIIQADLFAAAGKHPPFNWDAWRRGAGSHLYDAEGIAGASRDELAKLLLALERAERFCEGTIPAAYTDGTFLAIARRLAELGPPDAEPYPDQSEQGSLL